MAMVLLAVPLLLVPLAPARADVCNLDVNPAATLLLPFFEVDLDGHKGVNTVFSINNAFSAARLAHVVVWSDLGSPVLDFNVYLTGYDMEVIDLHDLLVNGHLSSTASDGQDPAERTPKKAVRVLGPREPPDIQAPDARHQGCRQQHGGHDRQQVQVPIGGFGK
jgi:hypothetical protein